MTVTIIAPLEGSHGLLGVILLCSLIGYLFPSSLAFVWRNRPDEGVGSMFSPFMLSDLLRNESRDGRPHQVGRLPLATIPTVGTSL
jgi:hypothetical protein